jgi:hypothetical protein
MANAFQGFERVKNLEENLLDRDALNNLGSTPIGDDINLLKNNKRNISSITVSSQNINVSSSTVYFTNKDIVFSNRTKIIVNGATYYVKNSDGKTNFQLSSNVNLSDTVAGANLPVGPYIRSDEITKQNFMNFSPRRRAPVEGRDQSSAGAGGGAEGDSPLSTSVKQNILNYETKIDAFVAIRNNSLRKNASFLGNRNLETEGFCLITDPDNVNSTGLSNTGPGLFIYNPDTNSGVRAFSSNENVWVKNLANTYLETSATKITIGDLFMSKEIVLEGRSGGLIAQTVTLANISLSETGSVFTHKVPVEINGETYFLCLTNS